jgi:uncharacterized protein
VSERAPNPRAIDLRAFCRHGGALSARWPQVLMPRLTESLAGPPGDAVAECVAQGSLRSVAGGEPEIWLQLQGRADVELQCQRCLQAMSATLRVDRRFRFVRDEDEAVSLDEECEDDVLVLPSRLDLLALFEDELILNLPLVPRHQVCPAPLLAPGETPEEAAPHPFAALAALRGGPARGGGA